MCPFQTSFRQLTILWYLPHPLSTDHWFSLHGRKIASHAHFIAQAGPFQRPSGLFSTTYHIIHIIFGMLNWHVTPFSKPHSCVFSIPWWFFFSLAASVWHCSDSFLTSHSFPLTHDWATFLPDIIFPAFSFLPLTFTPSPRPTTPCPVQPLSAPTQSYCDTWQPSHSFSVFLRLMVLYIISFEASDDQWRGYIFCKTEILRYCPVSSFAEF